MKTYQVYYQDAPRARMVSGEQDYAARFVRVKNRTVQVEASDPETEGRAALKLAQAGYHPSLAYKLTVEVKS
jgi:hypothetical protein